METMNTVTESLSIIKISQSLHNSYKKNIENEWIAIEFMEDFIEKSFQKSCKIYLNGENQGLDENGYPKSFMQFIS